MKATYRDQLAGRSFRDYLQQQLASRCSRNPQYSLRAFANYLGVNHSTLSQMIRGKRTISAEAIEKFGFKLGLGEQEVRDWVEREKQRPRPVPAQKVLELTRDTAVVVEDWRNFAILELTRLRDFQPDSRWIARMLGITVDEVNVCVSLLCRLGLLHMVSAEEWSDVLGDALLDVSKFQQAAVANLVHQLERLSEAPPETYDISSMTLAVPARSVGSAIGRIARFRQEFADWLGEAEEEKDAVYQLEIRFVPVTRRE